MVTFLGISFAPQAVKRRFRHIHASAETRGLTVVGSHENRVRCEPHVGFQNFESPARSLAVGLSGIFYRITATAPAYHGWRCGVCKQGGQEKNCENGSDGSFHGYIIFLLTQEVYCWMSATFFQGLYMLPPAIVLAVLFFRVLTLHLRSFHKSHPRIPA